ncbi:MAG: hypothetical protein IPH04_19130 [Saprospirales bacterium]|nr:hypothetical protein [Saprospirales bacterium]
MLPLVLLQTFLYHLVGDADDGVTGQWGFDHHKYRAINESGGSIFTLSSGATLRIGSTAGIASSGGTGNVQTGTRTFNTGAHYEYNGIVNQITGTGFPSNLMTLDN